MNSEAIFFGQSQHLSGIWSPADGNGESGTAVIMLTPGMLHHAGPFRLHVRLAGALAKSGISSLRFDLSGIGESFAVGGQGSSLDRAADETIQAIDWVTREKGIERIILFGLCSGADDALHTAMQDTRVDGIVVIDGCGYPTKRFYARRFRTHYLRRIFSLQKWRSLFRRALTGNADVPQTLRPGFDVREYPPQAEAEANLLSLAQRQTKSHFIYTGGVADYYNDASQFLEMFPKLKGVSNVSSHHFPLLDHVAFLCEDRDMLVRHIVSVIVQPSGPA